MNHPRTTQQVDIGRCLFRASDSHLQLQFATTARLSQPGGHRSTVPPVKVSQWQDLSSVWVTEAPELDIRLFIRVAPGLDHAASVLVADLGGKLCISPVCPKVFKGPF